MNFYQRMSDVYPQLLLDTEECKQYLAQLRWGNGEKFRCPSCNCLKSYSRSTGMRECAQCRHGISVTSGTIFQGSRQPLSLIFKIVAYVIDETSRPCTAKLLKRIFRREIGSYETAWVLLHKLRQVMMTLNTSPLSGAVEIGEVYFDVIGGSSRDLGSKAVVLFAVQKLKGHFRFRVHSRYVPSLGNRDLAQFIRDTVLPGTCIRLRYSPIIPSIRKDYQLQVLQIPPLKYPLKERLNDESFELPDYALKDVCFIASRLCWWMGRPHSGLSDMGYFNAFLAEWIYRNFITDTGKPAERFDQFMRAAINTPPLPLKDLRLHRTEHE